jgi:hypothetical protein
MEAGVVDKPVSWNTSDSTQEPKRHAASYRRQNTASPPTLSGSTSPVKTDFPAPKDERALLTHLSAHALLADSRQDYSEIAGISRSVSSRRLRGGMIAVPLPATRKASSPCFPHRAPGFRRNARRRNFALNTALFKASDKVSDGAVSSRTPPAYDEDFRVDLSYISTEVPRAGAGPHLEPFGVVPQEERATTLQ